MSARVIHTIGHSTRSIGDFTELLRSFEVRLVSDIRSFPRSKRNPQFNKEALPEELAQAGIEYAHFRDLGGLRQPRKDSINTAWRNSSFRGYADYMQSDIFQKSLDELLLLADKKLVALMCAEAVPWKCHRFLLSDALVARGWDVEHILGKDSVKKHTISEFAIVKDSSVTYPSKQATL